MEGRTLDQHSCLARMTRRLGELTPQAEAALRAAFQGRRRHLAFSAPCKPHKVSPRLLRFVECGIGALDDCGGRAIGAIAQRHAHADGYGPAAVAAGYRALRYCAANLVCQSQRGVLIHVFQDGDEFLSAEARHGPPLAGEIFLQKPGDLHQRAIARDMTLGIVEPLEVIDVDHHHRQLHVGSERGFEDGMEHALQVAAVGQTGQLIHVG